MTKFVFVFAGILGLMPCAALAQCDEAAAGAASYETATGRIRALPEFKAWANHVSSRPGVKPVIVPAMDKQQLIEGRCYWSVSAYADQVTHLHRWNTFYVSLDGKQTMVMDMEGAPISLDKWRAFPEGHAWRSGGSALYGQRPSP